MKSLQMSFTLIYKHNPFCCFQVRIKQWPHQPLVEGRGYSLNDVGSTVNWGQSAADQGRKKLCFTSKQGGAEEKHEEETSSMHMFVLSKVKGLYCSTFGLFMLQKQEAY